MQSVLKSLGRQALRIGMQEARKRARSAGKQSRRSGGPSRRAQQPTAAGTPAPYPGDFQGVPQTSYSPDLDGDADPGEIVWTWVPFEEDHSQGKDRPVLVIGRDGKWLLGLQLTSKDNTSDPHERAAGRTWLDIGSGPWDAKGRPSEIRTNRVLRLDPEAVRREGAIMPRETFDEVVATMQRDLRG